MPGSLSRAECGSLRITNARIRGRHSLITRIWSVSSDRAGSIRGGVKSPSGEGSSSAGSASPSLGSRLSVGRGVLSEVLQRCFRPHARSAAKGRKYRFARTEAAPSTAAIASRRMLRRNAEVSSAARHRDHSNDGIHSPPPSLRHQMRASMFCSGRSRLSRRSSMRFSKERRPRRPSSPPAR